MHIISVEHDLPLFKQCERCFWLAYKSQVLRKEPARSSFEQAAREKLHEYFDKYRGELPPDIADQMDGCLLKDTELISHWRNPQKGLRQSDTVMTAVLFGTMDDCLVQDSDEYIPVELRFMSREPFKGELKDREIYLDSLTYLLTANGYKTPEFGYVICCYPQAVVQQNALEIKKDVVRVDTDLMRAERIFYGAAELLRRKTPPEKEAGCPDCAWFEERAALDKA